MISFIFFFFFFSSRRRHTRLQGDWSSDVCSSDLCDVTANGRVNFYLLDDDNLTSLDLGEEFWSETGEEDTEKATLEFKAPQNGKWFLVVENTETREVSATANIRKIPPKTSPTQ